MIGLEVNFKVMMPHDGQRKTFLKNLMEGLAAGQALIVLHIEEVDEEIQSDDEPADDEPADLILESLPGPPLQKPANPEPAKRYDESLLAERYGGGTHGPESYA